MPGRRTTRSSVPSSPRKSLAARPSSSHRVSTPHFVIPSERPSSDLRVRICGIFADAQASTAGHRKLVIKLRKVQGECCYSTSDKEDEDAADEERFNEEMGRCVVRLMGVKKSEGAGDRVVRFLGLFLKHASEDDMSLLAEAVDPNASTLPETPTTRLTTHVLHVLLPLLASKDKTVRYRSTQLTSHIINNLDSIDDDVFQLLRLGLLKRIRDKEPTVRVQAVLGLGRLAGNDADPDQDENGDSSDDEGGLGSSGLLERLLEVMQNDPSADVRRSLLLNLPLTPSTLPYLLERARDQDAGTRRALYSRLLPALGDFRHLSLSMREKLLRWGLRDRDENVRKAAGKLFRERWIEDCAGTSRAQIEGGPVGGEQPPSFDGLLELLERIDVVNSGVENGVALEAMKGFWEGRPDYRQAITFDDDFWDHLTAESVFMARSFNGFCRQDPGGLEDLVDEKMPEVTKFAFYLERYTGYLVESLKKASTQEGAEEDEEHNIVEQEFIVEQLLHIASTLDFADEVGRRKTFALMRETLAIAELPEEVTRLVIEVLRCLCGDERAGEREFCDVVLEAVAEVHDTIEVEEAEAESGEEEDSFHSARSELSTDTAQNAKSKAAAKKRRKAKKPDADADGEDVEDDSNDLEEKTQDAIQAIMINMKCLHIASCMLSNIESKLQDNVHLVTMLNNLVVPAVRSHEAPIRERGLLCLGLCCLLDRSLAEENLTLFLHCFAKGHDALQVYALHIISDILTTHGSVIFDAASLASDTTGSGKAQVNPLFKIFVKALRADDRPEVQAASCTALCKLMLGGVIRDDDLLKALVVAYFDPGTAANLGLRQALSYFLPVYCHSKRENQERMQRVAVAAVHALFLIQNDVDEEEEMVGLGVIAAHLVEWTDPRRVVVLGATSPTGESMVDETGKPKPAPAVNGDVHLDLATDVLEKILSSGCNKEERKPLASIFSKLYITSHADAEKLRTVRELVSEAVDDKILSDAPSRNALLKLQTALAKVVVEEAVVPVGEEQGGEDETVLADEETVTEGMKSELVIRPKTESVGEGRDSLSELLDDDDEGEDTIG